MKNFAVLGAHPLEAGMGNGYDPRNLPMALMCYRAEFGSSAAMLPTAESSKENFGPFRRPLPRGVGG